MDVDERCISVYSIYYDVLYLLKQVLNWEIGVIVKNHEAVVIFQVEGVNFVVVR